jgi:D-aspartate ligase
MIIVKNSGVIIIEGHVQGLANTRALGKAGISVYVVDVGNCVARYSKYCDKFIKCPDFHTNDFADFLIELAENEDVNNWILLPSNDHAVYTISKHKTVLEKHYKFTIQDLSLIKKIYNKSTLLQIAQSCCVPIPETNYLIDKNQEVSLKFPVITKGKEGLTFYKKTGKKAFLANNKKELSSQMKLISSKIDIEDTFTQELIPFDGSNKTISFTAFCDSGEINSYWMGAKIREHPIQFGTATLTKSVHIQDCLEFSRKLLKKLDYTGVCEVEYLCDPRDKKYKLIEINPRTWLWVGLAIACGVNYPVYIYNFLNKIETHFSKSYEVGLKWYNPYTDFVFSLQAILKGKLNVRKFLTTFQGKKVNALWELGDLLPFWAYGILLLKMIKDR